MFQQFHVYKFCALHLWQLRLAMLIDNNEQGESGLDIKMFRKNTQMNHFGRVYNQEENLKRLK